MSVTRHRPRRPLAARSDHSENAAGANKRVPSCMSKRSPERCSRKCCGSPRTAAHLSVQSVRVCVGHFSGVEELLLASAFELATIDTIAAILRTGSGIRAAGVALSGVRSSFSAGRAALPMRGVRLCTGPHHGRRGARSGKREPYDCRRRRPDAAAVADDCPRITDRGIPCDEPLRCP